MCILYLKFKNKNPMSCKNKIEILDKDGSIVKTVDLKKLPLDYQNRINIIISEYENDWDRLNYYIDDKLEVKSKIKNKEIN